MVNICLRSAYFSCLPQIKVLKGNWIFLENSIGKEFKDVSPFENTFLRSTVHSFLNSYIVCYIDII